MNNSTICSDIPRTCRHIQIIDLNPHLMCVLCGGYYIDATTIIECLHSFCKTCIVRYLDTSKFCPICDVQVHKTKPLLNIRSDQTLQDIVYKVVPGLYQGEMKRRRDFYASHPQEDKNFNTRSSEERGEVESDFSHNIFKPDEMMSISLEYSESGGISNSPERKEHNEKPQTRCPRYLNCPVFFTVAQIKKLLRAKYSLPIDHRMDVLFSQDNLNDDYMLMDIAYIYAWKRKGPLKLFFRTFERPVKRLKAQNCRMSLFSLERFRSNVAPQSPSAKKPSSPAPEGSTAKPSTAIEKVDPGVQPSAKEEMPEVEKPKENNGESKDPADDRGAMTLTPKTLQSEIKTYKSSENGICLNNNSSTVNNKNKTNNNNNEVKKDENLKSKDKNNLKSQTTRKDVMKEAKSQTNGSTSPNGEATLTEKVNGLLPMVNGKDSAIKVPQVEAK